MIASPSAIPPEIDELNPNVPMETGFRENGWQHMTGTEKSPLIMCNLIVRNEPV